jgi:hypothetical protein
MDRLLCLWCQRGVVFSRCFLNGAHRLGGCRAQTGNARHPLRASDAISDGWTRPLDDRRVGGFDSMQKIGKVSVSSLEFKQYFARSPRPTSYQCACHHRTLLRLPPPSVQPLPQPPPTRVGMLLAALAAHRAGSKAAAAPEIIPSRCPSAALAFFHATHPECQPASQPASKTPRCRLSPVLFLFFHTVQKARASRPLRAVRQRAPACMRMLSQPPQRGAVINPQLSS